MMDTLLCLIKYTYLYMLRNSVKNFLTPGTVFPSGSGYQIPGISGYPGRYLAMPYLKHHPSKNIQGSYLEALPAQAQTKNKRPYNRQTTRGRERSSRGKLFQIVGLQSRRPCAV